MPEELRKADALMRTVSKILDLLLLAAASELLPKAGFYAGIFYILIGDGLFEAKSIGKKITGLQVISLTTQKPCTIKDSIFRNLPFALGLLALKIPFIGWILCAAVFLVEFLLMIGSSDGLRTGDMLANTVVVVRDDKSKGKEEVKQFASM